MRGEIITTPGGSTVKLKENDGAVEVVLDHPDAPADMRDTVAGRVTDFGGARGFQPVPFAAFLLSPATLRAIADLIERDG